MVKLHIKKGEESQFLYETTVDISVDELVIKLVRLYNGRLKVDRLCQGKLLGEASRRFYLPHTHPLFVDQA